MHGQHLGKKVRERVCKAKVGMGFANLMLLEISIGKKGL